MWKILPIFMAFSVGACAINPSFEKSALHYNRIVAETNNEQLFLNIIRAKEREPMYFSGFSQLSGELTYSVGGGVSADLPDSSVTTETAAGAVTTTVREAVDTLKPNLTASIVNNPSFDFQVLDTQEFFRGITKSLDEETVIHFLHQGWPPELLAALFIERADFNIETDGKKVRIGDIDNEPVAYTPPHNLKKKKSNTNNGPDNHEIEVNFGSILDCIEMRPRDGRPVKVMGIDTNPFPSGTEKGVITPLALPERASLAFDADTNNFELFYTTGDKIVLYARFPEQGKNIDSFASDCKEGLAGMMGAFDLPDDPPDTPEVYFTPGQEVQIALVNEDLNKESLKSNNGECPSGSEMNCKNIEVNLVFRSVQGAMYFLGEYIRADLHYKNRQSQQTHQGNPTKTKAVYLLDHDKKLIDVSQERSPNAFVSTELNNNYYQVNRSNVDPIHDEDYSLSVFALINQMLNLQKSASERPTTSSVRVR